MFVSMSIGIWPESSVFSFSLSSLPRALSRPVSLPSAPPSPEPLSTTPLSTSPLLSLSLFLCLPLLYLERHPVLTATILATIHSQRSSSEVQKKTRLDVIKKRKKEKEKSSGSKDTKRYSRYACDPSPRIANKSLQDNHKVQLFSPPVRIVLPPFPLSLRRTDEKVFPPRSRLDKVRIVIPKVLRFIERVDQTLFSVPVEFWDKSFQSIRSLDRDDAVVDTDIHYGQVVR
jgi:hypothetical protein